MDEGIKKENKWGEIVKEVGNQFNYTLRVWTFRDEREQKGCFCMCGLDLMRKVVAQEL